MFNFTEGTAADQDGHYVVRGLAIYGFNQGAAAASSLTGTCVRFYNIVTDTLIEDNEITGCDAGVSISGASQPAATGDGIYARITVKNNWIHHNSGNGFFGGARGLLIEGNTFEFNASRTTGSDPHDIYLSSENNGLDVRGMVVRGNTISNTGRYVGGESCPWVRIVGHGTLRDLTIEDNLLTQTEAGGGCWGISINGNTSGYTTAQDMSRIMIRNNVVVFENATGAASGIGANRMPAGIIENNTVIFKGGVAGTGINVPDGGTGPTYYQTSREDVPETFATIRNNSVYIDGSGSGARGVKLLWDAVSAVPDPGTGGDVITGNLIYMTAASSTSARCFEISTSRAIGTYGAFDRNICYRVGADAVWSAQHSTLALAQAAGFDTNSSKADPALTATPAAGNSWSMAVNTGSPAINACNAACSRTARGRYLANGTRDIGAHEFGATVVAPVGPSAGRAQ